MSKLQMLQQFRQLVYQCLTKRADAWLDLVDALAQADQVTSPVAVSEGPAFRRRFASIYDTLHNARLDFDRLRSVLYSSVPAESETIAGYEVYAVDVTPELRPEAETLADRMLLRSRESEPSVPGHRYSFLTRLIHRGSSWTGLLDVQRVTSTTTNHQVGREQVRALDQRDERPKVVAADSSYANAVFLAVFLVTKSIQALIRLRNNQVLYGPPAPYPGRGRKLVHGAAFPLAAPTRPADRQQELSIPGFTVCLQAWDGLHFKKVPALVGCVVQVQVLRPDGRARHPRPWWLFWTGPATVSLSDLFRMYAWRYAIEHTFRFLKQHLGLDRANVVIGQSPELWMWACLLAHWQLLLAQGVVAGYVPPWQHKPKPQTLWTPRQVQRALPGFWAQIGTPARVPKPAGKGLGRPTGFQPTPRTRYPVVVKSKKAPKSPARALP